MKLQTAVFVGAVVIGQASASAQNAPDARLDVPTVRVGLFTIRDDGQLGGYATHTADRVGGDLDGTLWLTPCAGAGAATPDRPIAASATDVWKTTGSVTDLTPEYATIQVTWQRIRTDGQDATPAPQTVTLTVKRGERTMLESVAKPAQGSCVARQVMLAAAFESVSESFPKSLGGGRSSSAGTGAIDARGTGGSASSSGGTGNAGAVVVGQVMKNGVKWPQRVNADLWLVRTSPGRPDETLHVTAQVVLAPATFAFAPITIQTASGAFTVKVQGTVESGQTPTGEQRFYFSANRTTSFAPSNRAARDAAPTVEGSTKTSVPMPGNDEVLSFELPPLRTPSGATVPDTLSVRVKLTREP